MNQDGEGRHSWIILRGTNLSFSPRFLDTVAEQLVTLAFGATGLDIRSGFYLSFHEPEKEERFWHIGAQSWITVETGRTMPYWDKTNIAYLDADLIGPDNWGMFVKIAWCCEAHENEQIMPESPLLPEQGHQIRVWWAHLPVAELRQKYLS